MEMLQVGATCGVWPCAGSCSECKYIRDSVTFQVNSDMSQEITCSLEALFCFTDLNKDSHLRKRSGPMWILFIDVGNPAKVSLFIFEV